MVQFSESLQERILRRRSLDILWEIACYSFDWHVRELAHLLGKAGYSPNQPRVPVGNPDGGQWTGGGGGRSSPSNSRDANEQQREFNPYPDAIEPVYPIETALTFFTGGQIVSAVRTLRGLWSAGATASSRRIGGAAKAIEDYLGGPGQITKSPSKDLTLTNNGRRIRFNTKNPHGHDPHFHVEKEIAPDKWVDAGNKHINYFKK